MTWRNKEEDDRGTFYIDVSAGSFAGKSITALLEILKGTPPIGETTVAQRLDALINMHQLTDTRLENIHGLIFELTGKVDTFMATQEERLQAILVAVKNVKQMLADLKVSNPAIEDEITAIEAELAPATEPPATGTEV